MDIFEVFSKSLENFQKVENLLSHNEETTLSGLNNDVKPYYLASIFYLSKNFSPKKPILIFSSSKQKVNLLFKQILFWNTFLSNILQVPPYKIFKYSNLNQNNNSKSKFLGSLMLKNPGAYLIPISVISDQIPSLELLNKSTIKIKVEQIFSSDKFINKLNKAGYDFENKVFSAGTYSKIGGIINVFPLNSTRPYRIEFLGNEIESIKSYDLNTNKIKEGLDFLSIVPGVYKDTTNGDILDYIKNCQPNIVLDEPEEYKNEIDYADSPKLNNFTDNIQKFKRIKLNAFPAEKNNEVSFSYKPSPLYHRNLKKFAKDISEKVKEKYSVMIFTAYQEQLQKLFTSLESIYFIPKEKINLNKIDYISGFINEKTKFILTFDKEILGEKVDIKKRKRIDRLFISELEIGDYIVHIDHGIGKYIGMEQKEIDEGLREFLIIEYERGDKLFLPAEYTDKISKYIGRSKPRMHRLHETSWQQIKEKIKHDAKKQAEELLSLYAQREVSSGFIFSPDNKQQYELENSFEYEETPDQLKVIKEIKNDMEGKNDKNIIEKALSCCKRPMDRLVCGDVGFGKTEIAIRAAFKATQDKKQTAILCPTTILAQQHYNTFKKRLIGLPCDIDVLSRFKTKKEQLETIKRLSEGKIDIIIGTHRLLSKDIKFKNLGLAIIDEEQRFGVKHKEKLKKMRANLDIIILSATPIPRTLNLALANLKNISTLETPPPGRLPVKTMILPKSDKVIISAIRAELARNGQVYYLHNRVETINAQEKKIQNLIPEGKFGIIHGQLSEKEIAGIMRDFNNQKIDVLICSTIIENGLDLPNANTLIVDNATRFGLADLYQLRGRIGRSKRKGYAYFFYQSQKLKDNAKRRLEALLSAKDLGSGFQVAMQDLEIRGAGNILGKEQSGNIREIGLNLYCRLLNQAVKELKTGEKEDLVLNVTIDLPVPAYIPHKFMPNNKKRVEFYQNIANIYNIEDLNQSRKKLENEKSKVPKELNNLYKILKIKILANSIGIKNIDTKIIQKFAEEKIYRLSLEFIQTPPYEKIKKLLSQSISCSTDENILKIDFEEDKEKILDFTKEILNLLKK